MTFSFSGLKSFIFDNKTTNQTIFKNTIWLGVETVVSRAIKLFLIIYVARILGATEYGKFTFALSFASLFIMLTNLGLPQIVVREFAKDGDKQKEFYSVLSLKIFLSISTFFLIFIGSFFITGDEFIRKVIWVLATYTIVNSFYTIINSFFNAHQRMEYEAIGEIGNALITTAAGIFIIFNFPSALNLGYAYLLGSVIILIFLLFVMHFKVIPLKIRWEKDVWKRYLSMSWPLALASLFGTICANTDSVMLGYFNQITQTGWYNAAYRIINIALLPMGLVAGSFFPAFSKFAHLAKEKTGEEIEEIKKSLQKVWDYDFGIMILTAVPLVVGGIILAPKIIEVTYGSGFLPSILAFQILIIMAGITFIYVPFSEILIASGQQKRIFWAGLSGAIANLVLNLLLIPKFSLYGSAAATVVTHSIIFIIFFIFASKYTLVKPKSMKFLLLALIAIFSSFLMYLAVSFLINYNIHVVFLIIAGAVVYGLSILFFKKASDALKIKLI